MTRPLNPDHQKIAENLRELFRRANAKRRDAGEEELRWSDVARRADLHKNSLSRVLGGKAGLSEEAVTVIAEIFQCHPGLIVAGIKDRDRYPHIPAPSNRNKEERARKGLVASSLERVISNDRLLTSFLGGVHPVDREAFRYRLTEILELAKERREFHRKGGRYNPLTGKFKDPRAEIPAQNTEPDDTPSDQ